jgi:hypothetical protein
MMLHAATQLVAALLQSTQAAAPCPQLNSDSPWKWVIQSLVPVAGGTLIAVLSFYQNKRSEQRQFDRNQKAAHEQWIRDQKKIEWQKLIKQVAKIEFYMPSVAYGKKYIDAVIESDLDEYLRELTQLTLECVYADFVIADGRFYHKLVALQADKYKALGAIENYNSNPHAANIEGLPSPHKVAEEFRAKLASILREIHEHAKTDLGISQPPN